MKAIRDTGNKLVAAMDVNDSVGIIDSHFPEADFFTDFELFDAHADGERQLGRKLDYVSITSPNFLHYAHVQWSLRAGADAICEKPLVLHPDQIDELKATEADTGRKIHTILQLRMHPSILALRYRVAQAPESEKFDVDLTYITSRGKWYLTSWKGATEKSGGIATNIGIHFFDMLYFVFGEIQENIVHLNTPTKAAGYLEYKRARVRWYLSLDAHDVPANERANGNRTYRAVIVGGEKLEFSEGFTELHTKVYESILSCRGFGVEDNRTAIETVSTIRNAPIARVGALTHPLVKA